MNMQKPRKLCLAVMLSFVAWFTGCAAEPEGDGQCSLDCSNAKWAGYRDIYTISPLFPKYTEGVPSKIIYCSPDTSVSAEPLLSKPVTLRFQVTKKLGRSVVPDPFMAEEEEEEDELVQVPYYPAEVPVAGVRITPILQGGNLSATKTNPENATVTDLEVEPIEYAGIVTPQSEWCTDSCGIATVTVWPLCIPDNEVKVGISIGSTTSVSNDEVGGVLVTWPEEEEDGSTLRSGDSNAEALWNNDGLKIF